MVRCLIRGFQQRARFSLRLPEKKKKCAAARRSLRSDVPDFVKKAQKQRAQTHRALSRRGKKYLISPLVRSERVNQKEGFFGEVYSHRPLGAFSGSFRSSGRLGWGPYCCKRRPASFELAGTIAPGFAKEKRGCKIRGPHPTTLHQIRRAVQRTAHHL